MKDHRLYILIRNDINSMTPGRACAQASHAANAFIHKFGDRLNVKEWQKQTKQGFGTAIVLSVNNHKMNCLYSSELRHFKIKGIVLDPEYIIKVNLEIEDLLRQNYDANYCNYIFNYDPNDKNHALIIRKEYTCAYIFGTKEELYPILKDIPLY